MSTKHEAEIEQMMSALGATTDLELSQHLLVGPTAIAQWRVRGVSKKAKRRFLALRPDAQTSKHMTDRRRELGHQVLYEGRSLAIWLAPSLDAFGRRFGATEFTARHREYASFFSEIEVACAEAVADRLGTIAGNATNAFELLTRDDPVDLLNRILARAHWWRYGDTPTDD